MKKVGDKKKAGVEIEGAGCASGGLAAGAQSEGARGAWSGWLGAVATGCLGEQMKHALAPDKTPSAVPFPHRRLCAAMWAMWASTKHGPSPTLPCARHTSCQHHAPASFAPPPSQPPLSSVPARRQRSWSCSSRGISISGQRALIHTGQNAVRRRAAAPAQLSGPHHTAEAAAAVPGGPHPQPLLVDRLLGLLRNLGKEAAVAAGLAGGGPPAEGLRAGCGVLHGMCQAGG